jgi:glutathione S-transferase
MNDMIHMSAFRMYASACIVVVLIMYVLAFKTGSVRGKRKAVVNAEDVNVYAGAGVVDVEHADVQRVKRAHLNAIENAVPFFVIGLVYAMSDPNLVVAAILYGAFVVSRILHPIFYLGARQPFRAASWMLGVVANVVMIGLIVRAALTG